MDAYLSLGGVESLKNVAANKQLICVYNIFVTNAGALFITSLFTNDVQIRVHAKELTQARVNEPAHVSLDSRRRVRMSTDI